MPRKVVKSSEGWMSLRAEVVTKLPSRKQETLEEARSGKGEVFVARTCRGWEGVGELR
jgi:hypothetical protein